MPALKFALEMNRFEELAERLRPEVQAAKEAAAQRVLAEARRLAPVLTGALRDSIEIRREGWTILIATDVFYAAWIERGTRRMPKRAFMKPARDMAEPEFRRALERVLR